MCLLSSGKQRHMQHSMNSNTPAFAEKRKEIRYATDDVIGPLQQSAAQIAV
jgi:hypothetical protein